MQGVAMKRKLITAALILVALVSLIMLVARMAGLAGLIKHLHGH